MGKLILRLEHELRGLDDDNRLEPTPRALVVGVLAFVVPIVVVALSSSLAVYFSV